MAAILFKLTEPGGVTRRVGFAEKPTWETLATRIQSLFGISIEKVSVAYIDTDSDQVTLSSEEELRDYYATSHQPGQIIKFIVQDLSALRSRNDPRDNQRRDPFSSGDVDLDDEWLGLGGVFVPGAGSDGPHAFVEVIESDADNSTVRGGVGAQPKPGDRSTTISSPANSFSAPLDKGKGRAELEDDSFSTASLLMEDAPPKPPVHVYEHGYAKDIDAHSIPGSFKEGSLLDESTPTLRPQEVPMDQNTNDGEDPSDPPLPTMDSTTNSSVSLTQDIASLIQAFNSILSSHPELSEGIRNIVRNAANGTYWAAHRDSISQAAQRVAQDAQMASEQIRRTAEEDAANRVSEALNGFFRTFSREVRDLPEGSNAQVPPHSGPGNATGPSGPAQPPPALFKDFPFRHQHPHMRDPNGRPPWMRWSSIPHYPSFGPGGPWGPQFRPPPGPPPPPPPHHPYSPPHFSSTPGPHIPGAWTEGASRPPPPPAAPPMHSEDSAEHELKAKAQEAKARYKAEKQKYREELDHLRQQRRHHFERHDGPSQPEYSENSGATERVIAVQGRKGNPTIEVVSVQRHHTFPGHRHLHRRFEAGPSDLMSRHVNRISRRLSDMGFTVNAYPDLQGRIRALMPANSTFNPDQEDNIVTTLLEELLLLSPKPSPT